MDSILTSIKKLLGIDAGYEHFDTDIIMHINSVFLTLNQIGVGPKKGFMITGDMEVWKNFISEDDPNYEAVKSYVYLRVRQLFDPPQSNAVMESMNRMISEYEWRLNVHAESPSEESGNNDAEEEFLNAWK